MNAQIRGEELCSEELSIRRNSVSVLVIINR